MMPWCAVNVLGDRRENEAQSELNCEYRDYDDALPLLMFALLLSIGRLDNVPPLLPRCRFVVTMIEASTSWQCGDERTVPNF